MKVKALLFATAAVVAMTASAGTPPTTTKLYANDVTIENAADKAIIKLILENPDQPDLSAFQIKIDAPEGFQFVQLTKKEAGIGSDSTQLKDGWVRGIGLEFGLGLMANLENGGYFLSAITADEMGVNEDLAPILIIAAQASDHVNGAKIAAGDYEFTIHCQVSGPNNDQSLYGPLADSTFKVTVQNGDVITGVNDINAKAVAGVKYYNLAGVESNVPFDGVNVVVTTYTDGTKAASKVIK